MYVYGVSHDVFFFFLSGRGVGGLPAPVPMSRTSSFSEKEMGGRMRRPERRRVYSWCCTRSLSKGELTCWEGR